MLPSFDSSKSKGKLRRPSLAWVIPWAIAFVSLSFSTFQYMYCSSHKAPSPAALPLAPSITPESPQTVEGVKQQVQEQQIQDLHRKVKGLQMTVELLTAAMGALNATNANHLHPSVSYDRHPGALVPAVRQRQDDPPPHPYVPEEAHQTERGKEGGKREREEERGDTGSVPHSLKEINRQAKKKLAANKRSMMRDVKSACIVRVDGRGPKVQGIDTFFSLLPEVDIPAHDIGSIDARTMEECMSYCLCREELMEILDERIHGDTSTKHRDIDTHNSLKGEVEEWEVCLGVTYLRAQWECWLKTSNDESMSKKARGDKKINGIAVKHPQLQTALLVIPSG